MKKILVLGLVLALMAILVVPVAAFAVTGTTDVEGTVAGASLSLNTPPALNFGTFLVTSGFNYAGDSWGNVTLTQGTQTAITGWSMTASGNSYMQTTGTPPTLLKNRLLLGNGTATPDWYLADGTGGLSGGYTYPVGNLTYTGGLGLTLFSFAAAQYIDPTDVTGVYSDTITFTASMTP